MQALSSSNQLQPAVSDELKASFAKTMLIHGSTLLHTCFAPCAPELGGGAGVIKNSRLKRPKDDQRDYILTLEHLHFPKGIGTVRELSIAEQRPT